MKSRTHFVHRVDMRTDDGENVFEHLAGVEDFEIAMATYRAACERWPGAAITTGGSCHRGYGKSKYRPADPKLQLDKEILA